MGGCANNSVYKHHCGKYVGVMGGWEIIISKKKSGHEIEECVLKNTKPYDFQYNFKFFSNRGKFQCSYT